MWNRSRRLATLGACALLAVGCVQLQYTHAHIGEPLPVGIEDALPIGEATVQQALDLLGAPTYVYGDDVQGISLAWTWRHTEGWGISLSYSISELFNLSGSYDDDGTETWGVFLTFDRELRLREARRALLSDVAAASIVARSRTPAGADH
jgi:hypothetical protein